jgi:hypothetical protein
MLQAIITADTKFTGGDVTVKNQRMPKKFIFFAPYSLVLFDILVPDQACSGQEADIIAICALQNTWARQRPLWRRKRTPELASIIIPNGGFVPNGVTRLKYYSDG